MTKLYVVTELISLICRGHHTQCLAGWSTNWNQDTRRNINTLRYTYGTTLLVESKEELKNLLLKVKVQSLSRVWLLATPWTAARRASLSITNSQSEQAGLKFNIQKMKVMASSPITSWQIDGETMEAATDFIFLGSKITADGDCSQEIKRHLLLGRKAMTNLDSILKSRDIILPTKVHIIKTMVFPVVMYVVVGLWRRLST